MFVISYAWMRFEVSASRSAPVGNSSVIDPSKIFAELMGNYFKGNIQRC